jgi:hypothetical protein
VASACDGGFGSFGGRRHAFGGFVDLAPLALDDLLNPLAEFAVVDDPKIASVAGRAEVLCWSPGLRLVVSYDFVCSSDGVLLFAGAIKVISLVWACSKLLMTVRPN